MFYCSGCGYKSLKWLGKCPLCEGWETFVEEKEDSSVDVAREKIPPQLLKNIQKKDYQRISTGMEEVDRILGSGLVKGEIVLVGGEPGVGKSTLLLEMSAHLSSRAKTLYVSAEESPQQVALRSQRLGADSGNYILWEKIILRRSIAILKSTIFNSSWLILYKLYIRIVTKAPRAALRN